MKLSSRQFRNLLFSLHKWLGVHILIYFAFMFTTGALLTFGDEIEAAFHPDIWVGLEKPAERASFGDIYDSIARTLPGSTSFVTIRDPMVAIADETYATLQGTGQVLVWTDPRTAEVLKVTGRKGFKAFIKELHENLLVPGRLGYLAVSVTSLLLLYSILSGLITYRKFWRGYFRWPRKAPTERVKWANWHRLLGIWIAPFLLITAVTGFYFFLGGLGIQGKVATPIRAETREVVRPEDLDGGRVDAALAVALAAQPDFRVQNVVLPGNKRQAIQFGGWLGEQSIRGGYTISIDPVTLDYLGMIGPDDNRGLGAIKGIVNSLHFGTWGGLASQFLWVGFALVAAGLVLSGAVVHAKRIAPAGGGGATRTYWRNLGLFRWLYVLVLVGIFGLFVIRFVF